MDTFFPPNDLMVSGMRGRTTKDTYVLSMIPMQSSDLELISGYKNTKPVEIKKLRSRHHKLARLLSTGVSNKDAELATGYCSSRISILKSDPAFKNLMLIYEREQDGIFSSMQQRLADVSLDALEEIADRIKETPEDFSNGMLLELVTKTADRSGNGPSSSQNINVNIGLADRLQNARERIMQEERELIDITPEKEEIT